MRSPTVAGASAGVVTAMFTADTIKVLVALAVGVFSALVARAIFTTREERRSRDHPPAREQWLLTLAALIVTCVTIWDRHLTVSGSAGVGFGVGLTISTILDLYANKVRQLLGNAAPPPPLPGVGMVDEKDETL